ncbi:MAG: hypothetical protein Kow0019_11830 [Methanobacteriaceae archaeon]
MHKSDFEQIQYMVKRIKIERASPQEQNMELKTTVEVQKEVK